MLDNIPGNFTIGIVNVSKHADPGHAGCHASWLFPFLNEFDAETAFFDIALFLYDPHIVRTGGNAIFTTDTFLLIHQHHPVFSLMRSPCRTDFHTGRVIAVLALNRQELATVIRKCSILPLFEVIVGFLFLEAVLIMASDSTGVTPYTFRFINNHSITSHHSLPLQRLPPVVRRFSELPACGRQANS
jgi:hypothetical protein